MRVIVDEEKLVEIYKAGKSASSIAKELKCSVWTIISRLQKLNITVRSNKQQNEKPLNLNKEQTLEFKSLVDGLLLGDGSIDKKGLLRLEQTEIRLDWLKEVKQKLLKFGALCNIIPIPPKKRTIENRIVQSKNSSLLYTPAYVELQTQRLRWYPKGLKIVPTDVDMSPIAMAYWFAGDGTYNTTGSLYFCTDGFTKNDVDILVKKIYKEIGVFAQCINGRKQGQYKIAIYRKNDAVKFANYIHEYLPKCCLYKLRFVRPIIIRKRKLSIEDIKEIRKLFSENEKKSNIAKKFGVSSQWITKIISREFYRDVL